MATITANGLYTNYRNKIAGSGNHALADWDTDTIKIHLIDTGAFTLDDTHEDEADFSAGEVATSAALGTVTIGSVAAGVVDAANTVFTAVSGVSAEALVYWMDSGTPATSPLLLAIVTATGLPVTPTGADITVVHSGSGIIQF